MARCGNSIIQIISPRWHSRFTLFKRPPRPRSTFTRPSRQTWPGARATRVHPSPHRRLIGPDKSRPAHLFSSLSAFTSLTQVQRGNWLVNLTCAYLQLCFTRTDSYPSQRMGECKTVHGGRWFSARLHVCVHERLYV